MSIKPSVKAPFNTQLGTLLSSLLGRRKTRTLRPSASRHTGRSGNHFASFEHLEPRQMLAIDLGSVVTIGGSGNEANQQTIVDHVGNTYAVGTFVGKVDFNPAAKNTSLKGVAAPGSVYVAKYNPAGALVWAKQIGDQAVIPLITAGLAVDSGNNLYIAGSFEGTIDFNPGRRITALTSAGQHDVFAMRIDTSGEMIWAKRFGGTGDDFASDIALNDDNYIFVSGMFTGEVDFDPGADSAVVPAPTIVGGQPLDDYDGFVNILDDQGDFLGYHTYDTPNIDTIAVDDDSLFLAGHFRGTDVDFDPDDEDSVLLTSSQSGLGTDLFVQKIDLNGDVAWVRPLTGNATITNIDIGDGGDVFVSGSAFGIVATTTPDEVPLVVVFPEGGAGFLTRSNGDTGAFVWANQLGSNVADFTIAGSEIFVTGTFSGSVNLNPSGAPFSVEAQTTSTFVGSYNADSGLLTWGRALSGTGTTAATSIGYADNNIVIGGAFTGTTDFDPNRSIKSVKSKGGTDSFIARIRQSFAGPSRPLNALATVKFTDGDGDLVTISLKGPGKGFVSFNTGSVDTNISDITLSGTTTKTVLTITNKTGTTTLGGATINGSLASIVAGTTTLEGDATITGDVAQIAFGDATAGSSLAINGTLNGTTLAQIVATLRKFVFRDVSGLALTSVEPIASINVNSWSGSGSDNRIVTPRIGTVGSAGAFTPSLTLSGHNLGAGVATLGSVYALGTVAGEWNITGVAGPITAGSIGSAWAFNSGGAIESITTDSRLAALDLHQQQLQLAGLALRQRQLRRRQPYLRQQPRHDRPRRHAKLLDLRRRRLRFQHVAQQQRPARRPKRLRRRSHHPIHQGQRRQRADVQLRQLQHRRVHHRHRPPRRHPDQQLGRPLRRRRCQHRQQRRADGPGRLQAPPPPRVMRNQPQATAQ